MEKYMINKKPHLRKNETQRSYNKPRSSLETYDYLFPCDFEDTEDDY